MKDVLEDRLTDLFDRVSGVIVVDDRLERIDRDVALEPVVFRLPRRRWTLVAAVVVVLAGAAGVVRVVIDPSGDRSVAQPVDPGPLYVLPTDLPGWTSLNGSTSAGSAGSYEGIVIGTPVDGIFIDPVAVSLTSDPPDRFSPDTWREVSAGGETMLMSPEDDVVGRTPVTRQLHAGWLTSSTDDPARNVGALAAVEVDPAGNLTIGAPDLEVIASYNIPLGFLSGTYSEAHGPADEYVVVETTSGEMPLVALVADRAFHLEPITVNGDAAWHASGTDVDGEWHVIAWEFSRHQTVAVSNHDSYDTLLTVAESLEVVDEATWVEAT